jgi:hypothetical protein
MGKHLFYHPEGYVEIVHSDYNITTAFEYTDEVARYKARIPTPPEGYHVLEDLTKATGITPAAKLIIRTLLATTNIHCCVIFGGSPAELNARKENAKDAGKEAAHHYFDTREEAVDWMMKNHNFKPSNDPIV